MLLGSVVRKFPELFLAYFEMPHGDMSFKFPWMPTCIGDLVGAVLVHVMSDTSLRIQPWQFYLMLPDIISKVALFSVFDMRSTLQFVKAARQCRREAATTCRYLFLF